MFVLPTVKKVTVIMMETITPDNIVIIVSILIT